MRWTPVKHDSRRRPGVQDPRRAPPARQRRLDEARSDARRGAPALYPSGAGSGGSDRRQAGTRGRGRHAGRRERGAIAGLPDLPTVLRMLGVKDRRGQRPSFPPKCRPPPTESIRSCSVLSVTASPQAGTAVKAKQGASTPRRPVFNPVRQATSEQPTRDQLRKPARFQG